MNRSPFSAFALAACSILTLTASWTATADLVFWTGADGQFQDSSMWDGSVPGEGDLAVFSEVFAQSDVFTVDFLDDVTTEEIVHEGIELTFDLAGNSYTVTSAVNIIDGDLTLIDGDLSAELFSSSGGLVTIHDDATLSTGQAIFGAAAGSNSQIDIAGSWDAQGSVTLGNAGSGELNIGHDGSSSTGDGGEATAESILLGASSGGEGTINLGEDATLLTDSAILGANSGASGTATVGDGAVWTNNDSITVGGSGTGSISIEDGGLLHTQGMNIADNGSAALDGSGSLVIAGTESDVEDLPQGIQDQIDDGGLFIANSGFSIVDGGVLEADRALIDSFAGANSASSTVTGSGSMLDLDGGELTVGAANIGSLNILNGGQVESGDTVVGDESGSTGSVTVSGSDSQWTIDGSLLVGREGQASTTIIGGGSLTTAGDVEVGSHDGGTGRLTVSGSSSLLDAQGDIAIGYDTGSTGALAAGDHNARLTVANGGEVAINGGAGVLTAHGSSLLDGDGVIDGHVQIFGRLRPDSPNASISMTGDLETHEGSVLQFEYNNDPLDLESVFPDLDPGLVSDPLTAGYITVDGQTTLADGTIVEVSKTTGGPAPDDSIIVIEASSGLDPADPPDLEYQGAFLLNWEPTILEGNSPNYLLLTAVLNEPELADFLAGLTGNESRVAHALDDGGLHEVLTQLDPDDPNTGLRTLLPLQHGSMVIENLQTSAHFHNAFLQEMAGLRISERVTSAAGQRLPRMFNDASSDHRANNHRRSNELTPFADSAGTWGGYISGTGLWDTVKSGSDRLEHRTRVLGVQGGVHHHLAQETLLGVAAGYHRTRLNFRGGFGEADTNTFRVGPYFS